jgi:hypothetical protein
MLDSELRRGAAQLLVLGPKLRKLADQIAHRAGQLLILDPKPPGFADRTANGADQVRMRRRSGESGRSGDISA